MWLQECCIFELSIRVARVSLSVTRPLSHSPTLFAMPLPKVSRNPLGSKKPKTIDWWVCDLMNYEQSIGKVCFQEHDTRWGGNCTRNIQCQLNFTIIFACIILCKSWFAKWFVIVSAITDLPISMCTDILTFGVCDCGQPLRGNGVGYCPRCRGGDSFVSLPGVAGCVSNQSC